MKDGLDCWYILGNDIDASVTSSWNEGAGFEPIGISSPFTGILDGQGHTISNLYINRPSMMRVGLFSRFGASAEIRNVGLLNAQVTGFRYVGTLIGASGLNSLISNCYATGEVIISADGISDAKSGGLIGHFCRAQMFKCYADVDVFALSDRKQIGGLCGFAESYGGDPALIENCYSLGTVTSDGLKVGGLVGDVSGDYATVSKCYSAGVVNGTNKKGLIGTNSGSVEFSYWDKEASGCTDSAGGTRVETTVEMRQQATFENWDFTDIWDIVENTTYPFLREHIDSEIKIYYVDDDAEYDPGQGDSLVSDPCEDGSSKHPFDAIQKAVNQAYIDCNPSCECNDCYPLVIVKQGWYYGPGNFDIDTLGMDIYIKAEDGPWWTIIVPWWEGRGFLINKNETNCTVIDGFLILAGEASPVKIGGHYYHFGGAVYCGESSPIIKNCVMLLNYSYYSGGAIYLYKSNAIIQGCELLLNYCNIDPDIQGSGGGIYAYKSKPLIKNCVVAGNRGYWSGGISSNGDSNSVIENCTIADNYAHDGPDGLECYERGHADIKNCIFWTDTRWWGQQQEDINAPYRKHLFIENQSSMSVSYTDIEGGINGVYVEDDNSCSLEWGQGNINADPCFGRYYGYFDYHLKSGLGRWTMMYESNGDYNNDKFIDFKDFAIFAIYWQDNNPPQYIDLDKDGQVDLNDLDIFCSNWLGPGENYSGWVTDDVNSPCIDAGDPCSPYYREPLPNGCRINMGAYGNTEQASKSQCGSILRRHPDLDKDGDVDFVDFALFAELWLDDSRDNEADFNYDDYIDEADLREFSLWWLWKK